MLFENIFLFVAICLLLCYNYTVITFGGGRVVIGAIYGDIVGSIYEFNNIKTKEFPMFSVGCSFTDDTVMTVAVADALMSWDRCGGISAYRKILIQKMKEYGGRYPDAGYGISFANWLYSFDSEPYNSYGNGSAMRTSPIAWYSDSMCEALELARATASVTHNHPEGIKGAVVTTALIFAARNGKSKKQVKLIASEYYDVDRTLDEIRPTYAFNETCQRTVPEAIVAFLESESFEDAIRCAISIGGDSDTLAAICGSIAEAYYGVSAEQGCKALSYLTEDLKKVSCAFLSKYVKYSR